MTNEAIETIRAAELEAEKTVAEAKKQASETIRLAEEEAQRIGAAAEKTAAEICSQAEQRAAAHSEAVISDGIAQGRSQAKKTVAAAEARIDAAVGEVIRMLGLKTE